MTENKAIKIITAALVLFIGVVVFVLAQDVVTTQAGPLRNPATTTPIPTDVPEADWYWSHEVVNLTYSHPGTTGTFWSDKVTAPGYEDVEAVYFEFIKRCPSGNSHWAKSEWENVGGSWSAVKDTQTCGTLNKFWWEQSGGQSYADTKTEIESRFGAVPETAISDTRASSSTEFRVGTAAGTDGDGGYTAQLDVYYLHHGPEAPCYEDIELSNESFTSGEIDATLEEGITEDLAEGGHYGVEITGGPWDDGSVDRKDAAYSWDGAVWLPLDGSTEEVYCVQDLETGGQLYYLEAQTDTLYLRVNDLEDEFDDNDDSLDYEIYGVVGSGETGCGAYYTIGSLVFEEEWDATFNDWQYPANKDWPMLTDVYFENYDIYRILIPHTYQDGIWYNAEAQVRPTLGGPWVDLATHSQTVCVEDHDASVLDEPGWVAYYFESPEDFTTYEIRAHDLDGDSDSSFDNNAGGFAVEVYAASWNPPVAGCASVYDLGPLIQNVSVPASAQNGIIIPDPSYNIMTEEQPELLVGTSYMLEEPSTWGGMYSGGGDVAYFDWEISADRSTWYDIDDFADCINPTDNHHDQYFFNAGVTQYYIRAKDLDLDGSWLDQTGQVELNLYYADDLRHDPVDGQCPNLILGDSIYSGSVASTNSEGGYLPDMMTPGQLYAIKLTLPVWTDDSVDQKAAQIKLGGDTTWNDFYTWDGAFCTEKDAEDWPTAWIQAADVRYMLRADDSIGDNSGWVNYTIYEADWIEDPIYPSCESDYDPLEFADFVPAHPEISAAASNGVTIQDFALRAGVYKIETSGGPWRDAVIGGGGEPPIDSYELEISLLNGAVNSWFDLQDVADCVVPLPDGNHSRYYVTIDEEDDAAVVRLRVNNEDDLWSDNLDSMKYSVMYSSEYVDPDYPWDPYPDGPFVQSGGCYLVCVRPDSSLNVPAWLEYFRCQLIRRISFCDYHFVKLVAMRELFYDREPFGSLQELGAAFGLVREQVDQYQWAEDGGGAGPPEVEYPENFIFASPDGGGAGIPLVGDDTIWGSGEIDIFADGGETFNTTCNNQLADSLGERLATPVCFAFNVIDALGLSTWFQLFWDITMIVALGMYFQNRWLKPMSS